MENKIYKKSYILVYVDAKKKDINKKIRKRKNYDKKIIKNLRKSQLPLEIKKKNPIL
jgi:dephospho-CoA kinase